MSGLDQSHVSARRFFFPHRSQSNTLSPVSIELAFSLAGLKRCLSLAGLNPRRFRFKLILSPVSIQVGSHAGLKQCLSLAGLNSTGLFCIPVQLLSPSPGSIQVVSSLASLKRWLCFVPHRLQPLDFVLNVLLCPTPTSIAHCLAGLNSRGIASPVSLNLVMLLCFSPVWKNGDDFIVAFSHADFIVSLLFAVPQSLRVELSVLD